MADEACVHNINVPLQKWIQEEAKREALQKTQRWDETIQLEKQSSLRKTTVAYGIVELLRHARIVSNGPQPSTSILAGECNVDNFVVLTSSQFQTAGDFSQLPWDDVGGVNMVSPSLSAQIIEPSFVIDSVDDNIQNRMGRYLEVYISPPPPTDAGDTGSASLASDFNDCHLFGVLLYELYSGMAPFPSNPSGNNRGSSPEEEPPRKRSTVRYDKKKGKSYSTLQKKPYTPLKELGFSSSISTLVQNLIDGHDEYPSLDSVSSDIHLLLGDPDCFLFDLDSYNVQGGSMQLQIKKGKLYGREKEVSSITEAFCRVSSGKNEAFFLGGYSGSGKTMLVQSLIARVDVAGGYVLTQKVEQMSKESPLLDVLSAFNELCILIRCKSSPRELLVISNKLMNDFESDFSVLARLLPNINTLFHQRAKPTTEDASTEQMMNLHNVSYTLQRFMRIVSSRDRPVMLFFDDLQWAGKSSLELIQALLSDTRGSGYFFFVGSYRDNEVKQGHAIFDLISGLDSSGVKSTKLHLCGLNQHDLVKPLSDIVFEKTEGNPMFAIEFLRSLVNCRLLKFSLREGRWIWDESKVRSENITDNVLYLLSAKMTSLPENTQLALKVISCFGIITDTNVICYLSSTSEYSDFSVWLSQAINEGCIQKIENGFKFVHDKVREAAYSLIPDDKKAQFHHNLGMLLYSASKGQDLSGAIFQVADQINHGISLIQPEMRVEFAGLNFSAGSRAINFSDNKTAYSYLKNAFALLPRNSWSSHYELSLRVFLLYAKSAYSCGKVKKAYKALKTILQKGRCVNDKLDAYLLHVTILHACEERAEAYTTCCEVLSQLNETVPDSTDNGTMAEIVKRTGDMLSNISEVDLMDMKETDSAIYPILKFYNLLNCIAFWEKPEMMPFIGCRMIYLTLERGVCQYSVFSLTHYAAILCHQCTHVLNLQEVCRVGKAALSLLKRFGSSEMVPRVYFCYYGFVAQYTEPLQLCTDNLRKGFEVGISSGDSAIYAFYNSIHLIRLAFHCGENLPSLLKETDYHLEVMTRFRNKLSMPYLTSYRETISMIIDKGGSTSQKYNSDLPEASNLVYAQRHTEVLQVNKMLQSFWLGYSTRCHHYAKKVLQMDLLGRHNKLMILFYAALNSFRGIKNNNGNGSQFIKAKPLYKDAISALRTAAELSSHNFSSKVYLLEAEMNSFEKKYDEARSSYAAAITSSCSSRYVHEQGLAYELAGLHYAKFGEAQTALDFFREAKQCYLK
eukprot:CAMPEP_0181137228 /NCGR_PEP_ID=MMETSP1071-20121207/33599_1 /TAXON_ID=35127 /ORGANISM="Thalassiosira sp., Strain NH16" /LENGTH=1245 /DNA_ID=CAMNT_0023223979 /DNA_START=76 /DNA_END=3809 /DNA_ORIENTATION=-